MSGHSKWSTIKRKKAKADAHRGRIFTKIIREITVAARDGGGDIETNPALRTAVQTARINNMPNDNVEKAIKRGTGELPGVTYEVCAFEGYAQGGVAVFVKCLSDNRNRTSAEVRHLFSKYGGHLGEPHSVSYLFDTKGQIVIDTSKVEEDRIYELALENGAEDITVDGSSYYIISPPDSFEALRDSIVNEGLEVEVAEVSLQPTTTVKLDRKEAVSVLKLVNALEDLEDVQSVSANFDIPDEVLEEIEDEI